jgi:hypothetical protein
VVSFIPEDYDLTIVTNSTNSCGPERTQAGEVIMLAKTQFADRILGSEPLNHVREMLFDQMFIGVCGLDLQAGLTAVYYEDACFKKEVMRQSNEVIAAVMIKCLRSPAIKSLHVRILMSSWQAAKRIRALLRIQIYGWKLQRYAPNLGKAQAFLSFPSDCSASRRLMVSITALSSLVPVTKRAACFTSSKAFRMAKFMICLGQKLQIVVSVTKGHCFCRTDIQDF